MQIWRRKISSEGEKQLLLENNDSCHEEVTFVQITTESQTMLRTVKIESVLFIFLSCD